MAQLDGTWMFQEQVVHVPKVVQQERQHHFHVEEMVDIPIEQPVETQVHVPLAAGLWLEKLELWWTTRGASLHEELASFPRNQIDMPGDEI